MLFRSNKKIRFVASVLFAGTLFGSNIAQAEKAERPFADLLLVNGKIITVDDKESVAESVAVIGDKIYAVGSTKELAPLKGKATKVIDLAGKSVLPGFIDAHTHIAPMANVETFSVNIQAPPLAGAEEIVQVLVEHSKTVPPGTWIWGQGTYNQEMPSREQLDAALPEHPVRLDWSAHDIIINHKAAQVMGLDADYPDPDGVGRLERTPDGEVMIIRDAHVPWPKREQLEGEGLKNGVSMILNDFFLEKGVTTVQDHVDRDTARALQELHDEGALPIRVRMTSFVRPAGDKKSARGNQAILQNWEQTGFGDDWLYLGAIKLGVDGVWGTTAYTYKPAWKGSGTTWVPGNHGGSGWQQDQLNELVLKAQREGWQLQTHANGDRGQDMVLDAYEYAQSKFKVEDPRYRIEHFGHFLQKDDRSPARLKRMRRLGVIPSSQIAFLWRLTDTNVQEPDLWFFPLRLLIDEGFHVAGGVDTIGTQNFATSPFFSIARAVLRDTKYGTIVQPEQSITPMEAIKMFTIWAAEAGFVEDSLGSIEPGKLADLIILSADPLTVPHKSLGDIEVDVTIIDGRVVYER